MTAPAWRRLGRIAYRDAWLRMRDFTDARDSTTRDELWLCEHPSVYTLGQAGRQEHLLDTADIPVVQSDRGGQVTWHGPGQPIVYVLFDLKRAGYGIRELVERLEGAVIDLLSRHHVVAEGRRDAPGVYVAGAKVAALGLRVRRGCTYHGVALNVDADLGAFAGIDPCGHQGLAVTRTRDLGIDLDATALGEGLLASVSAKVTATE